MAVAEILRTERVIVTVKITNRVPRIVTVVTVAAPGFENCYGGKNLIKIRVYLFEYLAFLPKNALW